MTSPAYPWISQPGRNQPTTAAAGRPCSSDGSSPAGADWQIDRIIAELEALFAEARQLRTRYQARQQEPYTSS
jgi:hypothetical protein